MRVLFDGLLRLRLGGLLHSSLAILNYITLDSGVDMADSRWDRGVSVRR
jgi:hypothetical protein